MNHYGGLQAVLDRGFARLATWCVRHTRWVIGLSVLALAAGVFGAAQVRQDNSLDAYFNEEDTSYAFYKEYIEEFSSDEVIFLLYDAPDAEHGPFDLNVMRQIGQLTDALESEVPFVRKVTSLANVEFIESDGDTVEIHALLSDFPDTQEALLHTRDVALSKPLYVDAIVSRDGRYAAVIVEMSRTSTDPIERLRHDADRGDALDNLYPQVPDRVMREILQRPEYQGIRFWISGDVPMNSAYNHVLTADTTVITLVSLALVVLVSAIFFKNRWLGLFAPLAVVLLSLALMLGLMGLMGWRINLFFMMIPTLLCAVGVAQSMHVLHAWQQYRARTDNAADAVRMAIEKVATPCLLAAVTTAVGFLGMAVSNLRAIRELSWYSAFGVMCTFVLTLTLLIVLAARSKPSTQTQLREHAPQGAMHRMIDRIVDINLTRPALMLVIFGALLIGSGVGLSRLKVDFNFLEEFKPSHEWRAHTEFMNDAMGGLLSVVYLFDTGTSDGIKNLELLREVEALQTVAESQDVVQDSISVVDILKELHQAFHGGDPAYYRLPEDADMLAQLLLVYELSGGKEMNDVLNLDRSKTALQIRLKLVAASEVRVLLEHIDTHLRDHPVTTAQVEISGIGLLWVRMAQYITSTQIQGYAVVFILITLMMIVAFGSVKIGLLGMIPNLFPIVVALGVMGWVGWHLDYLRLLLATIAISIALDDTIHMLARLRTEFAECGRYRLAVRRALHAVGPPIIATTAVLVSAVSAYLLSSMAILTSFGVLLALTMIVALLADLFLLPALVLKLQPFGPEHTEAPDADLAQAPA